MSSLLLLTQIHADWAAVTLPVLRVTDFLAKKLKSNGDHDAIPPAQITAMDLRNAAFTESGRGLHPVASLITTPCSEVRQQLEHFLSYVWHELKPVCVTCIDQGVP